MAAPIYQQFHPVALRWPLYVVGVMTVVIGIGLTLPADLQKDPSVVLLWIVAIWLGSSFAMLGKAFSTFGIRAEGDQLAFGYPWWQVSLPVATLTDLRTEEVGLMTYNGLGWRVGLDGTIAYVPWTGPAVVVTTPDYTYAISCEDPEALLETLRALQAAVAAGDEPDASGDEPDAP